MHIKEQKEKMRLYDAYRINTIVHKKRTLVEI